MPKRVPLVSVGEFRAAENRVDLDCRAAHLVGAAPVLVLAVSTSPPLQHWWVGVGRRGARRVCGVLSARLASWGSGLGFGFQFGSRVACQGEALAQRERDGEGYTLLVRWDCFLSWCTCASKTVHLNNECAHTFSSSKWRLSPGGVACTHCARSADTPEAPSDTGSWGSGPRPTADSAYKDSNTPNQHELMGPKRG